VAFCIPNAALTSLAGNVHAWRVECSLASSACDVVMTTFNRLSIS